jgi:8-amino-7-oxononanoate synthase
MDGDTVPLVEMLAVCDQYHAHLVIDEAHATGVIGEQGEGLVQQLQVQEKIFARVHTFGKACGCHGAVVLGSVALRSYLCNFARSFIYTTSLPEQSVHAILKSYQVFPQMHEERAHLAALIKQFQLAPSQYEKLISSTPIQGVVVPGNDQAKELASYLQANGLDVRAILYPTVPKGRERLRIVLHAFNTSEELRRLLELLQ